MGCAVPYIPDAELDSDVRPRNEPMWTCEKCGARNWDEASTCHKCHAPIAPEQARAIKETPPKLARTRPTRNSHPFRIPQQVELVDGGRVTAVGGGSFSHLEVRDPAGTQYIVGLHENLNMQTLDCSFHLSLSSGLCDHPSPDLLQVISMLENVSFAPAMMTKGQPDEFLCALRDYLVQKLETLAG